MKANQTAAPARIDSTALYDEAVCGFGAALVRLARSYELDADKRQDAVLRVSDGWVVVVVI